MATPLPRRLHCRPARRPAPRAPRYALERTDPARRRPRPDGASLRVEHAAPPNGDRRVLVALTADAHWLQDVWQLRQVRLADIALATARRPRPRYSSQYALQDFTPHPLFALWVRREFLPQDYRGLEQLRKDWSDLQKAAQRRLEKRESMPSSAGPPTRPESAARGDATTSPDEAAGHRTAVTAPLDPTTTYSDDRSRCLTTQELRTGNTLPRSVRLGTLPETVRSQLRQTRTCPNSGHCPALPFPAVTGPSN
jgi:hypothetical protein